jgi:hypothetical protein
MQNLKFLESVIEEVNRELESLQSGIGKYIGSNEDPHSMFGYYKRKIKIYSFLLNLVFSVTNQIEDFIPSKEDSKGKDEESA